MGLFYQDYGSSSVMGINFLVGQKFSIGLS